MLLVIPDSFFTPASLGTLASATLAVVVICNTIQNVFNFSPKWFALAVSILISIISAAITTSAPAAGAITQKNAKKVDSVNVAGVKPPAAATADQSQDSAGKPISGFWKYVIAVMNGFLLFATATGSNQIAGQNHPPDPPASHDPVAKVKLAPAKPAKRKFNARWWS